MFGTQWIKVSALATPGVLMKYFYKSMSEGFLPSHLSHFFLVLLPSLEFMLQQRHQQQCGKDEHGKDHHDKCNVFLN
jgi:hypothetical protein